MLFFLKKKLLRGGGGIEIAVCEGGGEGIHVSVYMHAILKTREKLPHDIVESVVDI